MQPLNATEQLAAWIAEEEAIAERLNAGPGPGLARPEQLAGKTGLEMMEAMLRAEIPYAAIAKTLDFSLISVAPGQAVFQARRSRGT
jgi:hypothetical protein